MQWHDMTELLEDRETTWDDCPTDIALWGGGINNMTTKVLPKAGAAGVAPTQESRMEGRTVDA
jgi:hypothetical protein